MARLTTGSRSVDGKIVIVTGAASGMGRATAHLFADEGALVVVVDLSEEAVDAVVAEISGAYGPDRSFGVALDVTDTAGIGRLVDSVADRWGGVDILVNNAGISMGSSIDHPGHSDAWDRTLAVNLTAHVHMIRACLPYLKQCTSGGRIINIASTEGLGASAMMSPYTAANMASWG